MFTGLVEETGEILKVEEGPFLRVHIAARRVLEDLKVGDSVAVDGACLTAVAVEEGGFGWSSPRRPCAAPPPPGGWGTGPTWSGP
ncbi:riboflavin synthase subunit alpha [Thermus thermophilus]|nr:riboflavin synthase subunit alpha [Thermus thermophilus]